MKEALRREYGSGVDAGTALRLVRPTGAFHDREQASVGGYREVFRMDCEIDGGLSVSEIRTYVGSRG